MKRLSKLLCISFILFAIYPAQAQKCREITEQDIEQALLETKEVVFYTWNPYMPLSILGLEDSREFFKNKGITFIPLLDNTYHEELPNSKFTFKGECLTLSYDIQITDGMYNHFPGYFYFSNGTYQSKLYGFTFHERIKRILLGEE